jgi:hypothetical protein
MPQVYLHAEIGYASELCEMTYGGEIVPRDKQTKFCLLLPLTCSTESGDIDVGFMVVAEVLFDKVDHIPKEKRLAVVSYHTACQVKRTVANCQNWSLYKPEEITFYGEGALTIPAATEVNGNIEIVEALATHFREATARHAEVEKALEKAKDYLDNGLDYANHDSSRISRAAYFVADCMKADGTPMMGAWNAEKSAVLLAHVKDLVKRKNPNHPNYRSMVDWIRQILYLVKCPTYWAKYPPQPHLLDLR